MVAGIRSPLGRALREAAASPHGRVIVPDADLPVRLHVADGHLTAVECGGGTCVRGVGHDLQALLVLARRSARPRWGAEADDRPRSGRVPLPDAVTACEAAVTPTTALPPSWVDPRVAVELGAGPPDGGELRVRPAHWRVLTALLVGGLPAVAADDAWDVAAEILQERAVAVRGAQSCPVLLPVRRAAATVRSPIGVPPRASSASPAPPATTAPSASPARPAPEPRSPLSTVDTVTVDTAAVQAALDRAAASASRAPAESGQERAARPTSGTGGTEDPAQVAPQPAASPMAQRVPGRTLRSLENGNGGAQPDRVAELREARRAAERAASSAPVAPGPAVEPDTLRRLMQRLRNL